MNFTKSTKANYRANWHHDVLCQQLDRIASGELKRLIVEMPPRNGKSELVSRRLPAYLLGRNPDEQIIACSYSHSLAGSMNRDVQRIVDSTAYHQIFADTRLSGKNVRTMADGSWLRNNEIFEVVGHAGFYKSAGVGGGITGLGFTVGIVDDPFKDEKEASSQTVRDSVWEWFTSTFMTRAEKDAAVIICMTRWNLDDIVGRLLKEPAHGYEIVRFPAIAEGELEPYDHREEGEPLWPEKYSAESLAETRKSIPASQWAALYQQSPIVKGGSMFKPREWIKPENYVRALPAKLKTAWYWDNAGTQGGGAHTSGTLAGMADGNLYIIKNVAGQWSAGNRESVKRSEAEMARARYGTTTVWCEQEPGSGGKEQFLATTRHLAGFAVKADKVTGSKELRAEPLAAQMEVGNVFIYVSDNDAENAWIEELTRELESFPKGQRKDRVDSTSGVYAALTTEKEKGKITFL